MSNAVAMVLAAVVLSLCALGIQYVHENLDELDRESSAPVLEPQE